ncbi:hypothetical protein Nepgr_009008 [Nepenthes gracilis]|uniref:Uncharacterized protein n=1 Tax=Nepenthes gracilis TaxID=150966 RepID=A0AAD3XJS3_NEPGR|nr:hypothetical protein Nepgr_009008 [Nepenthes gracilis]
MLALVFMLQRSLSILKKECLPLRNGGLVKGSVAMNCTKEEESTSSSNRDSQRRPTTASEINITCGK